VWRPLFYPFCYICSSWAPTSCGCSGSLQTIRVGTLKIAGKNSKRLLTQIPPELNALLARLGFLQLFAQPPAWAET
jgi:hypothetical protein